MPMWQTLWTSRIFAGGMWQIVASRRLSTHLRNSQSFWNANARQLALLWKRLVSSLN